MYEIFEDLCAKRGVTPYRVSKETGISTATLTSWKQGKYTPKEEKMQKIADYLGVSRKYLLTGKEEENKTDEEYAVIAGKVMSEPALMDMIDDYMLLDDVDKANVRQLILSLSKKNRD